MKYLRYLALLGMLMVPLAFASIRDMSKALRFATTGITPIIHTRARRTGITARAGFRVVSLSARDLGITADGAADIIAAATDAASTVVAAMNGAGSLATDSLDAVLAG